MTLYNRTFVDVFNSQLFSADHLVNLTKFFQDIELGTVKENNKYAAFILARNFISLIVKRLRYNRFCDHKLRKYFLHKIG